jgi:hypothetical protein
LKVLTKASAIPFASGLRTGVKQGTKFRAADRSIEEVDADLRSRGLNPSFLADLAESWAERECAKNGGGLKPN